MQLSAVVLLGGDVILRGSWLTQSMPSKAMFFLICFPAGIVQAHMPGVWDTCRRGVGSRDSPPVVLLGNRGAYKRWGMVSGRPLRVCFERDSGAPSPVCSPSLFPS